MKIRIYILKNNGVYRSKEIEPIYDEIVKALGLKQCNCYLAEYDIKIGKQKYHLYFDDMRYAKNENHITGKSVDEKTLLIGTIVITKLNKNGNLLTLSSKDILNIKEHLVVTRKKKYIILGGEYYTNPIILKF